MAGPSRRWARPRGGETLIADIECVCEPGVSVCNGAFNLDAGNVSVASLTLRPEVRVPADGLAVWESRSLFSFAPRLVCEEIRTSVTSGDFCGGAEVGWIGASRTGMTNARAQITVDRIGDSTRSGLLVSLEHRF